MPTVIPKPAGPAEPGPPAPPACAAPAPDFPAQGVLAFRVGREAFAVDILQVREIRNAETPLHIVGAPPAMLGVLHLREQVVPLVCLRRLCRRPGQELPESAGGLGQLCDGALIVVDDGVGGRVAARVDAVTDVIDVQRSQLRAAPPLPTAPAEGVPTPLLGLIARSGRAQPEADDASDPAVEAHAEGAELLQWLDLRQLLQRSLRPAAAALAAPCDAA